MELLRKRVLQPISKASGDSSAGVRTIDGMQGHDQRDDETPLPRIERPASKILKRRIRTPVQVVSPNEVCGTDGTPSRIQWSGEAQQQGNTIPSSSQKLKRLKLKPAVKVPDQTGMGDSESTGIRTSPAGVGGERRRIDHESPVLTHPWPVLQIEALHGLAGIFVRLVAPHTEADPVALLISFLVAFGNIIGRSGYFLAEADRHYTNLYAVLVGSSSKGRKGTSFGHIRKLFQIIEMGWVTDRICAGLSSGEGLIWKMRDRIHQSKPAAIRDNESDGPSVNVDSTKAEKRLLCQEGEFASVLKVLERQGNTLSAIIRAAWDTGCISTLTKNSPANATDTHISLIGHITKDELLQYFKSTEAANGFGNRFLWVCTMRAGCLPEGGSLTNDELTPLITQLHAAIAFAHKAGEMKRDEEARQLWYDIYPALSAGKPGLLGAITGRAEAQVMRLACIYALLDSSPQIRRVHLEAALAIWHYCEDSALYIFGDSTGNKVADELYCQLLQTPNGMTRNDIGNHFNRHAATHSINKALALLSEHGKARVEIDKKTGGRPAERWFAICSSPEQ